MKRLTITSLYVLAALMFCASPVMAYIIDVYTEPDPIQDDWQLRGEVDELGNQFPPDEMIDSMVVMWQGHVPCPKEFQEFAVQVRIINRTHMTFPELYYVADLESTTLTNYDEWVGQVNAAGIVTQPWLAFKIDAVGENTPLVYEDRPNGLFEPGEAWEFVIQDYRNIFGLSPAAYRSVGSIAALSSHDGFSSGSIITPEPTTIVLLGLGSLVCLRKRKA